MLKYLFCIVCITKFVIIMEISELKTIIEKSGLSAYKIEKDLGISNGTLGQVLKGKKPLPEKYEAQLRQLAKEDERDNPLINAARGRDTSGINEDEAKLVIEGPEEPISADNYTSDPEQGEVDLNEYEKADCDKFVGEVMNSEPLKPKKQVKHPLMDIADLL